MKKNNSKKWLAIGLAILLFVASSLVSTKSKDRANEEGQKMADKYFENYFSNNNKEVIEGNNESEKIAVLSYQGAIGDGQVYDSFMDELEDVKEDDSVKGVIMKVNSP